MTDKEQSDALRLAGIADDGPWTFVIGVRKQIAAELRRQSAEIETLRAGYEAARLEIESLKAQLAERASRGQAPAVKREFTNELGNSIRITVEGPNSMHENIVTPMEAKQLREALNEHAQKSAPAGAMPECLTCSDHGAVGNILTAEPCPDCTRLNAQPAPAPMSPANRLVAYSAATRLRELGFEWDATAEAWLQPAQSAQAADSVLEDALDAAFEAVRLLLCGLERYSFVLDYNGVVRRVRDRVGNWIAFDAAHELFDPAAVDAAIVAKQGGAAAPALPAQHRRGK